ncbi:MAG TPA: 2-isopropylmalate synthase [Firmicutes bacterium]|nr:2-isopropylmalate synthase [Bacillota bacterium]
MQQRKIKFLDTTLRDGEQTPGVNLNLQDKLRLARELDDMRIDVIEAGFAGSSEGDFEAVSAIAKEMKYSAVASLSRAVEKDIIMSARAVEKAVHPVIHTFIATSEIHMRNKLRMTPEQVYDAALSAVRLAKKYSPVVEFSCEDATRTDKQFLYKILEGVIEEGATVVNIPDTVGYILPAEYFQLIQDIKKNVKNIKLAEISVHCHDDLGNAVANSISGVMAGASFVEGTINGIGERAGNAALEEVMMNLYTRRDYLNCYFDADTHKLYRLSKIVGNITNIHTPANKAVVGDNAFTHQSGIHQHGVLADRSTYEIMSPADIGAPSGAIVLGKLSGKHALEERLGELGFHLNAQQLDEAFRKFKDIADRKREVTNKDLIAIANLKAGEVPSIYNVKSFRIYSGNGIDAIANLVLERDGQNLVAEATGSGPVDAAFKAIDQIVDLNITLQSYDIKAVTSGKDALGEVSVIIRKDNEVYRGRAVSTDIIESSILAYIAAVNRLIFEIEPVAEAKEAK